MRNIVKAPSNRITQGTIFFGARSPYAAKACYGVGITARCDTAREFKASTFTFLPVVCVEDWMWHEVRVKAAEDQIKSIVGTLRSRLIAQEGTDVVLTAFGVDAAFSKLNEKDKAVKAARDLYDDAKKSMELGFGDWVALPKSIKKLILAEFAKLTKGLLQEYFFLDQVEAFSTSDIGVDGLGYVVIMRDVRSIGRPLALELLKGMDRDKLSIAGAQDNSSGHLYVGEDDLILPVGELISPYVEKLMQNFSMLFGRIGTRDVPDSCLHAVSGFLEI